MNINQFELRFNNTEFSSSDEGLKVSGYVNKTNQLSQELGLKKKFKERILPGAFRKALQRANEVHFYAEHDPSKILASTRNGSLSLREDDKGLYMEATIEDTSWGRDYYQLIQSSILRNMSFGMRVAKDSWKKLTDGTYERSIEDLDLFEVSAVRSPAYVQSSIAARSIEVVEDVEIPEEEKREMTIQEQIEMKKSHLKHTQGLADLGDTDSIQKAEELNNELRALENKLKSQTAVQATVQEPEKQEERVLAAMKLPEYAVPKDLSKAIIEGSRYPVLAGQFNIFEGTGYHKKLFSLDNAEANIVAEMTTVNSANDPSIVEIYFQQKRVASATDVSQKTLQDSAIDLPVYVRDIMAKRILKTFQSQAFGKGNATSSLNQNQFQSIFEYNTLPDRTEATLPNAVTKINNKSITELTGVTVDNVEAVYNEYVEDNAEEAIWVVDSASIASGLKYADGKPLLIRENRANGSIGTIYGFHVYVQKMEDAGAVKKGKMVLMNPKAYAVSVNGDSEVRTILGDTTQQMKKTAVFLGEVYAQGKIVNPYAIKIIK